METALPTEIDLQIVTPERRVVSETVTWVSLPGRDGRLGILPGHAPLISELAAGVISYVKGGKTQVLAAGGGFTEVLQGRVIVLAETAERADEVDIDRAERAKKEAEEALGNGNAGSADVANAQAARARAQARLDAAHEAHQPASRAH
ncbi:MAG: F0F1 ATP synthase subunit epsilon [Terriglobia bacterium]